MKILGEGELTKKLTVAAHGFSATAREKIEKAGGSVTYLRGEPMPKKRVEASKQAAAPEPEPEDTAEETDV